MCPSLDLFSYGIQTSTKMVPGSGSREKALRAFKTDTKTEAAEPNASSPESTFLALGRIKSPQLSSPYCTNQVTLSERSNVLVLTLILRRRMITICMIHIPYLLIRLYVYAGKHIHWKLWSAKGGQQTFSLLGGVQSDDPN